MCPRRIPIQCIIPPHMVRKLAESKDPAVRARALQSISLAARIRGRRDVFSLIALPAAGGAGLHRSIYTAGNGTDLPGTPVRDEGAAASGDPAVDEAYDGLGATYDLYEQVYGRNSLDDKGLRLIASVHYGQDFENAQWDGRQMLFGDGDDYFNRFTIAIDVIGHELTHGVTQYTSGLEYNAQSGALNESISDVFGSLVKQHSKNQAAKDADWLIGLGLFTDKVQGGDPKYGPALRSMLHPGTAYNDPVLGKDPQPDNMRGYVQTQDDNGGVHTNSGIPNRAFAETAVALGGNAWDDAGHIWYKSLLRFPATAQFQDAADTTYQVAGEEFGSGSDQQKAVLDGWAKVGIKVSGVRPSARRARGGAASRAALDADGTAGLAQQIERLADDLKKLTDDVRKLAGGSKR
jgi:Zn-dependent metalloprotease